MTPCEGCGRPATTEDREGAPLCAECAEDSHLCNKQTFGGQCVREHGHDGPCANEDTIVDLIIKTTPDDTSDMGWWCIAGEELMDALKRARDGDDPDIVYAELYANSRIEHVEDEP